MSDVCLSFISHICIYVGQFPPITSLSRNRKLVGGVLSSPEVHHSFGCLPFYRRNPNLVIMYRNCNTLLKRKNLKIKIKW